jgi:biofilm PGA synthesis N-glycosyltransferase PgaC
MEILFWLSVATVAYVYVGYPGLLQVWARRRPRPVQADRTAPFTPEVSIVVAAHNEGSHIAARIDNLLQLDYPADRRQIIVVSDGSTDDTLSVLARYRDVVDIVAAPHGGKALALNAGVARATSDIVVFADARQVFAPDALRELTAPFQDPTVGGVTGELLLDCESPGRRLSTADRRAVQNRRGSHRADTDRRTLRERRRTIASTIADGIGLYWRYEKRLRRLESTIHSTLGATGAIYALRRALWRPLPDLTLLDDVLTPMRAVLAGYRVVFNDRARAFDRASENADAEARRKVRTLAGNYQVLKLEPRIVMPWRNPVWLQYVSHKIGRLAVPHALLLAFSANVALAGGPVFYQITLAAQVGFYLLAGYGALLDFFGRPRPATAEAFGQRAPHAAQEVA